MADARISQSPVARGAAVAYLVAIVAFVALAGHLWSRTPEVPTDDAHLIVPGARIGPIEVHMSEDQATFLLGQHLVKEEMDGGDVLTASTLGLKVQLSRGGHPMAESETMKPVRLVSTIIATSDQYRTAEGLHIGDLKQTVLDRLGPARLGRDLLIYDHRGIIFDLDGDVVRSIMVTMPDSLR